jgi:hypothetical protein
MAPNDAVLLDNFICKPNAIKIRGGYEEHHTKITDTVGGFMAFQSGNFQDHKMFATSPGFIHDVTAAGDVFAPNTPIPNDFTGVWSYVNYSIADKKFLVAVNNGAGYWVYDPDTKWEKQTIAGLPNDKLTSVSLWQNRIWVTVEGYSSAFYLGIGEIKTGATAEEFDYGPMFRRGGSAQVTASWSHDSGTGPNNYQVILSNGGDAVVYKGTDPDNADNYTLVGTWYVGNIPKGDRFISQVSGDLYILTDLGIISMKALTSGKYIEDGVSNPIIGKIFPVLAQYMSTHLYSDRWEMRVLPWLDIMIITAPKINGLSRQLVQCISSGQWSTFSGVPITASEVFNRKYFFADSLGKIYIAFECDADGQDKNGTGGKDVVASFITAFNHFGAPTNLKRFLMIRPMFIGSNPPAISLNILIDYKITHIVPQDTVAGTPTSAWDVTRWDEVRWQSIVTPYAKWYGVDGVGYAGALQMRVKGNRDCSYIGSLISVEVGGLM